MWFSKVSIIGLGYIGLPTAAAFASRKVNVIGVDIDENIVKTINSGKIHIVEPELDMLVHAAVTEGYLKASTCPEPADAFIISVPTPFKDGNQPDLSHIKSAANAIATVLKPGDLVVLESTSPVGTTQQVECWLMDLRPDLTFPSSEGEMSDIRIAYCPERVLPGHIVRELVDNDRIVGGVTPKCTEVATSLYEVFVSGRCISANVRVAELTKLAENSFRDVNIAFANELSKICNDLGVDVWEMIDLANLHPRVNILRPGPGVGGHCLAVDPWFIVSSAPEHSGLIRTSRVVNDSQPDWVVSRICDSVDRVIESNPGKCVSDLKVACLGLAYKPGVDDVRESPAIKVVNRLAREFNFSLSVVDPYVNALEVVCEGIEIQSIEEAIRHADLIVVLVAHNEFVLAMNDVRGDCVVLDFVGICN